MPEIYSVLITGANRGLGLEFVKQFLSGSLVKTHIVIAACRSPEKASVLQELKKSNSNLQIIQLDVLQFDSFSKVANEVESIVSGKGLTLLINNAAVGSGKDTLDEVTADDFISHFKTNNVAPVMLTKALRPLLKKSAQAHDVKNKGFSVTRAAVINITSYLGSVKLNSIGRYWMYRETKAALNMSTQSLSLDLHEDGILVEAIHPGHVVTDMGGPQGAIDTVTSITGMIKVMLQLTEKNKDGFWTWEGAVLPY